MSILVTGGAGYIGAHVVRLLTARGDEVVVVDDLTTGLARRIQPVPVVQIDLARDASVSVLRGVVRDHGIDSVIHLAARKQVAESVARPVWYYKENLGGLANVLLALEGEQVDRFVFSSSAAVYGSAVEGLVSENVLPRPANPYGQSKLAGEWLVRAAADAFGFRQASLRYFNVAGAAAPELGDRLPLNLLTLVLEAISNGQKPVIFGDDYPTPDGTGVRDYVHVDDLARAHLAVLDGLAGGTLTSDVFNVGTGHGASVRDVLAEVERVSGTAVEPRVIERRPGDPAAVVADATRIKRELGWSARHRLPDIVESAWLAHQARSTPESDSSAEQL